MVTIPVRISTFSINRIKRCRDKEDRTQLRPIIINPIRKMGANACTLNASCQFPVKRRMIALDNPQPGHGIPVISLIGHCQNARSAVEKMICIKENPIMMKAAKRLLIILDNTGFAVISGFRNQIFVGFLDFRNECLLLPAGGNRDPAGDGLALYPGPQEHPIGVRLGEWLFS